MHYPSSARPTDRRGVFNLVEEEPPGEDQDEDGAHPEKNQAEREDRPDHREHLYRKRWWEQY